MLGYLPNLMSFTKFLRLAFDTLKITDVANIIVILRVNEVLQATGYPIHEKNKAPQPT